jgi:hypothetical protein
MQYKSQRYGIYIIARSRYATSGHGFGLRPFESGGVSKWPERFLEWMEEVCPPLASKL